ncbi:hypothetical protein E4U54_008598 [Claviceps lovelessii]|nr:hypothetical protein E4U54_008598 [Claviceps lovelessii]
MQYLTLILAATALASAARVDKRLSFTVWCSGPIPDNGTCARFKLTSSCCTPTRKGKYNKRKVAVMSSQNNQAENWCNDIGYIYCV